MRPKGAHRDYACPAKGIVPCDIRVSNRGVCEDHANGFNVDFDRCRLSKVTEFPNQRYRKLKLSVRQEVCFRAFSYVIDEFSLIVFETAGEAARAEEFMRNHFTLTSQSNLQLHKIVMGKHVPLDCDWVEYAVPFRLDKNERKFYPVKILDKWAETKRGTSVPKNLFEDVKQTHGGNAHADLTRSLQQQQQHLSPAAAAASGSQQHPQHHHLDGSGSGMPPGSPGDSYPHSVVKQQTSNAFSQQCEGKDMKCPFQDLGQCSATVKKHGPCSTHADAGVVMPLKKCRLAKVQALPHMERDGTFCGVKIMVYPYAYGLWTLMVFKDARELESVEASLASMLDAQYRGFDPKWLHLEPIVPGGNVPRGSWDTGVQFHWSAAELGGGMLKPIDLLFRHETMRAFVAPHAPPPQHGHGSPQQTMVAAQLLSAMMPPARGMMPTHGGMMGSGSSASSSNFSVSNGSSMASSESLRKASSDRGGSPSVGANSVHSSSTSPHQLFSYALSLASQGFNAAGFMQAMQQATAAASKNNQKDGDKGAGTKHSGFTHPAGLAPPNVPPLLEGTSNLGAGASSSSSSHASRSTNAHSFTGIQLPSQLLFPPLPSLPTEPPVFPDPSVADVRGTSHVGSPTARSRAASSSPMEDDADAPSSSLHINLRKRKPNQRKSYYPEHDDGTRLRNESAFSPREARGVELNHTGGIDSRVQSRYSPSRGSRRASLASESGASSSRDQPHRKSRRTATRPSPSTRPSTPDLFPESSVSSRTSRLNRPVSSAGATAADSEPRDVRNAPSMRSASHFPPTMEVRHNHYSVPSPTRTLAIPPDLPLPLSIPSLTSATQSSAAAATTLEDGAEGGPRNSGGGSHKSPSGGSPNKGSSSHTVGDERAAEVLRSIKTFRHGVKSERSPSSPRH